MNIAIREQKAWRLIFFMHNIYDHSYNIDYQQRLIDEIATGKPEGAHILTITDKVSKDADGPGSIGFNTFFSELVAGANGECHFESHEMDFHFQSGRNWQQVLALIDKYFPADRTILITVTHGAALALDPIDKNQLNPVVEERHWQRTMPRLFWNPLISKKQLHRTGLKLKNAQVNLVELRSADKTTYVELQPKNEKPAFYCKKVDALWVTELAAAIKSGFQKKAVDVIIMNNCYMQNLETGFSLLERTRYMVAPEGVIMSWGYNFGKLIEHINQYKEIPTEELLRTMIPDYLNKKADRKQKEKTSLSIVDLDEYPQLKKAFDKCCRRLRRCTGTTLEQITIQVTSRLKMVSVPSDEHPNESSNISFVDIVGFFNIVKQILNDAAFTRDVDTFIQANHKYVIDFWYGQDFRHNDRSSVTKYDLHGTSIFLPLDYLNYDQYAVSIPCAYFGKRPGRGLSLVPFLRSFTKTTAWDEFLKRFISQLGKLHPAL